MSAVDRSFFGNNAVVIVLTLSLSFGFLEVSKEQKTIKLAFAMGLITGDIFNSSFQVLISTIAVSLVVLVALLNILKQILFVKKDEPPVVFHWFPYIGSAVSYGQEPAKSLKECQAKVRG